MKPNQRGRFNNRRNSNNNNMPRSAGNPQIIFRNTSLESTGPCGKLRGTPLQLHEKYLMAAKDAQIQNDDVLAETCFQYADHYMHVQNEAIANEQALHAQQQAAREAAEAEAAAAAESAMISAEMGVPVPKPVEEPKVLDVSVPVAQMNAPAPTEQSVPAPEAESAPAPTSTPSPEPKRRVLRPRLVRKEEGFIPPRPTHTTI